MGNGLYSKAELSGVYMCVWSGLGSCLDTFCVSLGPPRSRCQIQLDLLEESSVESKEDREQK